ncbi:MAG: hypothetical protein JXR52_07150 [Bacteroidales bacterium]|nr:hypothetical protein [Bacteroidales bacterium]MBN2698587.1 hypothetical protein [Bacteroidales bacterium]
MKKLLLIIAALTILFTTTDCTRRAYTQTQGLMLTNKYNQPTNKKKSRKAQRNYVKRQKTYQKIRR